VEVTVTSTVVYFNAKLNTTYRNLPVNVAISHFPLSLIFAGKTGAYPSVLRSKVSLTRNI